MERKKANSGRNRLKNEGISKRSPEQTNNKIQIHFIIFYYWNIIQHINRNAIVMLFVVIVPISILYFIGNIIIVKIFKKKKVRKEGWKKN